MFKNKLKAFPRAFTYKNREKHMNLPSHTPVHSIINKAHYK